jgi:hypothetical protein
VSSRGLVSLGAIIVVSLIIGFAIGILYYSRPPTTTTVTAVASGRFYEVAFTEASACSPPVWQAPWGVVLDGRTTIIRPSNASLPLSNSSFIISYNYGNYSIIWFSLPNGTYSYSVIPRGGGSASSGNVTVSGSDTTVEVYGAATVLCTSISSAS